MLRHARRQPVPVGEDSGFYRPYKSPLKTVFEDSPPPLPRRAASEAREKLKYTSGYLQSPRSRAHTRPQNRKLRVTVTHTPSALLHNDWYLSQLFDEVHDLYKPGALTGYPFHLRADITHRHLSLLRELCPGSRIQPLLPSGSARSPDPSAISPPRRPAPQVPFTPLPPPSPPPNQPFRHTSDSFYSLPMPPRRKSAKSGTGGGAPVSSPSRDAGTKRGRKDLYADEAHIFSARSKVKNVDLTSFFASPSAWSTLSPEEQEHIRSLLPPDILYEDGPDGAGTGAPVQDYLRYDNDWREQLRLFQEDLSAGHYEPEWLEQAQAAAKARSRGDFDDWKEKNFEQYWGQKSDAYAEVMAGAAVKLRLGELVTAGLFRVGDVFVYARSIGKGADAYLVEKDSTIVEICGSTLTFTMPPGMLRRPRAIPDSTLVSSPSAPAFSATQHQPTAKDLKLSQSPTPLPFRHGSPAGSLSLSRPGTSDGITLEAKTYDPNITTATNEDAKPPPNKKRFGFLGSLRRPGSSSDKESSNTSDRFRLRRKPVAKMHIVPHDDPAANHISDSSSDSGLSTAPSDVGPEPWSQNATGLPSTTRTISTEPETSIGISDAITVMPKRKPVRTQSREKSEEVVTVTRALPPLPTAAETHHTAFSTTRARRKVTRNGNTEDSIARPPTRGSMASDGSDVSYNPGTSSRRKTRTPKSAKAKSSKKGSAAKDSAARRRNKGEDDDAMELDNSGEMGEDDFDADAARVAGLVVISGVDSLKKLENKILEVDGRKQGEAQANGWRLFRCVRGTTDLGSLWDMREEYYKEKYG